MAAGSECVFAGGVSGECDGGLFGVSCVVVVFSFRKREREGDGVDEWEWEYGNGSMGVGGWNGRRGGCCCCCRVSFRF